MRGNTGTANLGLTFHFDIADGLPTTAAGWSTIWPHLRAAGSVDH
ncbi:hypothetical protein HNR02_006557 [Amycolatopsis endophytica]|uniref:Uncharacterized protein n=1 Tax=Amycolatopsis endophytica TaxID=860233 RepID=A0A853BET1_9PSEU|nr:hypothetical protein [Amycolatopsis endophytica]NYI93182.1 hypothetical protein [Amycolatopsis endophytica]